jgi:hypothetical protein
LQVRGDDGLAQAGLVDVVERLRGSVDEHRRGDESRARGKWDGEVAEAGDGEAGDHRRPEAEAIAHPDRDRGAEQAARAGRGEDEPELGRCQLQVAGQVQHLESEYGRVEERVRSGAQRAGAEQPVAPDYREAGGDLAVLGLGLCLRRVDPPDEERGGHVRHCVDEHGERCRQELDEHAGDAGSGDLGDGSGLGEAGVAGDQALGSEQGWEVRGGGDVVDHR